MSPDKVLPMSPDHTPPPPANQEPANSRGGRSASASGGNEGDGEPGCSNYAGGRGYAHGAGRKVWVGLPGNPEFPPAPLKQSIPAPDFREPAVIEIPDNQLDLP
jgi:hypothetical protein